MGNQARSRQRMFHFIHVHSRPLLILLLLSACKDTLPTSPTSNFSNPFPPIANPPDTCASGTAAPQAVGFSAAGGAGRVTVRADATCPWKVFISGPPGNFGEVGLSISGLTVNASRANLPCDGFCYMGSGEVNYRVPANATSVNRGACILIEAVDANGNVFSSSGFQGSDAPFCTQHVRQSAGPAGPAPAPAPPIPSCPTAAQLEPFVREGLSACSGSPFATEGLPCINADERLGQVWANFCSCRVGVPLDGLYDNPLYRYFAVGGGITCPPGAPFNDPCRNGGGVLIPPSQYPSTCGPSHYPPG